MDTTSAEKPAFETALDELEALVESLESGELSLDAALQAFEHGIGLTRTCQEALQAAEQRVEILNANTTDAQPEPFDDGA
jgi:exodeoxyribonuclease VII small subunit